MCAWYLRYQWSGVEETFIEPAKTWRSASLVFQRHLQLSEEIRDLLFSFLFFCLLWSARGNVTIWLSKGPCNTFLTATFRILCLFIVSFRYRRWKNDQNRCGNKKVIQFLRFKIQASAALPATHPKPPDMTTKRRALRLAELVIFYVCHCNDHTSLYNALGCIFSFKGHLNEY